MRNTIVVGLDNSPDAKAAAHYAADLAVRRSAPLKLVHVYESLFYGYGPLMVAGSYAVADDELRKGAGTMLAEVVSEVRCAHPGVEVTSQLTNGNAAAVLIAESKGADVTVVGSRGIGGFIGLMLGSVSAQVAAHGHGTVLVVRPAANPEGPVVVGYDGSSGADAALSYGALEALTRKVPLVVVHAYSENFDVRQAVPAHPSMVAARQAEQLLNDAVELPMEQHPGLEVKTLPIHSPDAARVLVQESARAGLTVVGCRGRGGFTGLLLGSVSRTLVHHAAGPVAVVHPSRH